MSDTKDITRGLIEALDNFAHYSELGMKRVESKYTWDKTALGYYQAIKDCIADKTASIDSVSEPDESERLLRYLQTT